VVALIPEHRDRTSLRFPLAGTSKLPSAGTSERDANRTTGAARLSSGGANRTPGAARLSLRASFYVWVGAILAVAVAAVVLGWHSSGGTPDPTAAGAHMSRTAAVIDSAILVFREGLETILVLAAVTASFLGGNRVYRRPVAAGGAAGLGATVATWFVAVWFIGELGGGGLDAQAATGLPAIVVLLLVMNWFFHRMYWTGWIAHHHKRRRGLLAAGGEGATRRLMLGLGLLGFTSIYREGFEVVLFLQNLRLAFGSSVVLEGVTLGCLFTAAAGVLTFALHQRLPYKRLLIITGILLAVVLFVMVGEEVNEMQLAGWIPTTPIGVQIPGWAGQWFSLFPNVQTIVAQVAAISIVLGSYLAAQYVRVWRPRRRGQRVERLAERPPAQPIGRAEPYPTGVR
jgi:high-affinity iron transporter